MLKNTADRIAYAKRMLKLLRTSYFIANRMKNHHAILQAKHTSWQITKTWEFIKETHSGETSGKNETL